MYTCMSYFDKPLQLLQLVLFTVYYNARQFITLLNVRGDITLLNVRGDITLLNVRGDIYSLVKVPTEIN